MNTSNLKKYGPEARRDFIKAVRDRAAYYGLTADEVLPMKVDGEAAIIGDNHFPASIAGKRKKLEERIKAEGFDHVMEAIAYTWFNRLVAIRYMELHDYLDHGYRVLSHPEGDTNPEILAHAEHLDLPGLANDTVVYLKLAGDKDSELYRLLLIAQCNALSKSMPFLFERIDDESELLLPENLLKSDSLVRRLVSAVPEEEWQDIEVIGWIYQFYISEKKDEVMGKVVKSEDIPAATQLFTPNWIVKYMVQNSLGAQWLATYPDSKLKEQMEYYIEPAEQTGEVNAQLAVITPGSLNPEELTLIDPACGSGHILVEAYDLFKAIYLERGYRQKDVPKLILEKNLFGLDIDERAAQLSGFALIMKGRADDRQLFGQGVKLNVMALANSEGFDAQRVAQGVKLTDFDLEPGDLTDLTRLFEHSTTFGSLIQVPEGLAKKLPALRLLSESRSYDLFVSDALERLTVLLLQAHLLASQYSIVVANPPYMYHDKMNPLVKEFVKDKRNYPRAKADLCTCFIERSYTLAKTYGHTSMVTLQNWMFLSSFKLMREGLLKEKTIMSMAQIGYNSFPSMNSKVAQATVFSLLNQRVSLHGGVFLDLNRAPQSADKERVFLERSGEISYVATGEELSTIPGSPLAYWVSDFGIFKNTKLKEYAESGGRTKTHKDELYVRMTWEVAQMDCGRERTWIPYEKGGDFRKWYGERRFLVNWSKNARDNYASHGGLSNSKYWERQGVTWSDITSATNSFRLKLPDAEYSSASPTIFNSGKASDLSLLSLLNSKPFAWLLNILNPTLHVNPGDALRAPVPKLLAAADSCSSRCVALAKMDWDAYEHSSDFQSLPLVPRPVTPQIESSYNAWLTQNRDTVTEMKLLEEENNHIFIDAYGLQDELTSNVPIEQITLTVNPAYRYGDKLTEDEQWSRFREDTMEELVSYAIGCMMGRYSLDAPGLIYAHSGGNEGFDDGKYTTFPADDDGIIPLTDAEWFDDDATERLEEFVAVAWDKEHLEENMIFLANNLSPNKGERSPATIRRYMSQSFFKNHLRTYKKRPIYWLFSSGKNKALECLVYLHRYNEGTLSRMRTEYVIPLQGKVASRISQLSDDITAGTDSSHRKKLQKRHDILVKHREELRVFDEKLRHYADLRIHIDLDDGVKVNYGKFGDLLANVKDITGKKPVKA